MQNANWIFLLTALLLGPGMISTGRLQAQTAPGNSSNASGASNSTKASPGHPSDSAEQPRIRITLQTRELSAVQQNEKTADPAARKAADGTSGILIIDCNDLSAKVTADDKGNISYSFTTTGQSVVTSQNSRIVGKEVTLQNNQLLFKEVVLTTGTSTFRAAELTRDVYVTQMTVSPWTPEGASQPVPHSAGAPTPDRYFPEIPNSIPAPSSKPPR